jgi:hypothetical protein
MKGNPGISTLAVISFLISTAAALAEDPPARVARLNYIDGTVTFLPATVREWVPAAVNYPLKTDDRLWTEAGARAELHLGSTAIRLGEGTSFGFLNVDDRRTQISLVQGSLSIRLRRLSKDETFEIDSPNSAVTLLKPGRYRINVVFEESGVRTDVVVRASEAEVTAAGSSFRVEPKQEAKIFGDPESPMYDITAAPPLDDWEKWSLARDVHEEVSAYGDYVENDWTGFEDLGSNGTWRSDPVYGRIWAPTTVVVGWAPYRFGRWAWIEPWGWTWIDDAPWGFAPFHYGRWAFVAGAWVWAPGPPVVRPVFAPALVGFYAGGSWSASFSFGVGGGVAWFPLAPGEPFVPVYRVTPTYVSRVNVAITNFNVSNVNVTNINYANRSVPGAITAVSRETFSGARPVGSAAVVVPPRAVSTVAVAGTAPPIAPRAESVLGRTLPAAASVARPPAAALSRAVVTRMTPPPPPVPFANRAQALAAHPGVPLDAATLASIRSSGAGGGQQVVKSALITRSTHALRPARAGLPAAQPARVETTGTSAAAASTSSAKTAQNVGSGMSPVSNKAHEMSKEHQPAKAAAAKASKAPPSKPKPKPTPHPKQKGENKHE